MPSRRWLLLVLLCLLSPASNGSDQGGLPALDVEAYFRTLERPASPNHWLAAPADFPGHPDGIAPVFAVPVAVLQDAFKSVLRLMPGAEVVSASAGGMHLVVTTRIFRFRDDVRVQFIPLGPQQSTLALYSASRVGYWDFGTNRRRVEDWLARLAAALDAR